MDDVEHLPLPEQTPWWHATVACTSPSGVDARAAQAIAHALAQAKVAFHFVRKDPGLRLRTTTPVNQLLDGLTADGLINGWTPGVYEPEVAAFGGPQAMEIAHTLFCADSPATLVETGTPGARERSILLLATLLRTAGLDPFEVGDVWDQLAALRPPVPTPTGPALEQAATAMRRLMNADAARRPDPERGWQERVEAFANAGTQLRVLATRGHLTRGLRAVLAHHAIFAFNRAGIPADQQAATALIGSHLAFTTTDVSTRPATAPASTLTRMENTLNTPTPATEPAELRHALVDRLTNAQRLRTPQITDAFRHIERHRFLPGVDPQQAYVEDAVPIKHDATGEMISCISAPSIVATQLEQLDAQPGHKILEAGAATGYNAALLGHLVGPRGHVWTIDVDPDLVETARTNLAQAGVANATPVLGDGAAGLPEHAPYDRIQFTVGAGDIPVKILDQLAPTGRLVLPMRIRGSISRSFAFERDGNCWRTVSCEMSTFVPLRKGVCDDIYTRVPLQGEGALHVETFSEQQVDRDGLSTALEHPPVKAYTGVKLRAGAPWEWLYLYLACTLPNGLSRMPGSRPGFTPSFGWGAMAALEGSTLAYFTVREGEDDQGRFWEIGTIGHGPRAAELTDHVLTRTREWDQGWGNTAPEPGFRMATGSARDQLTSTDGFVIDKPHSRLVVDWPRRS
ncbi:methyltransferase, FxLD system [Nocardiopsis terrae]|uniref:methyltransferase, FxLD system n=1 Tax=Streptomyces sp. NPDC057554 TaxID=3350538 RepID=UPI0036BC91DC